MYHSNRFLTIEDLLSKAEPQSNGCFNWLFGLDKDGYGRFKVNGKIIGVHRRMATLAHGEPQPNQIAMHSCDNPSCINPEHLSWGTHLDNHRDKVLKGRQSKGRNHGRAKYSQSQVDAVLAMIGQGETINATARHFGINRHTIYRFIRDSTDKGK